MTSATAVDVKAECMIDLVDWLRTGDAVTSAAVAQRYGVSKRTAQRYLLSAERYVPLEVTRPRWHFVYRRMRSEVTA